jgi:hypothetical protein
LLKNFVDQRLQNGAPATTMVIKKLTAVAACEKRWNACVIHKEISLC